MDQVAVKVAAPEGRASGVIRRSLLWRVMILVAIGMGAVLAAFGVSSLLAVNESTDRTLDEHRALAQATAGHVDYVVRQSLEALDEIAFAEGFDMDDGDPQPEQQAVRRAYLGSIFSGGVYLVDAGGRLLWAEPGYPSGQADGSGSSLIGGAALASGRPTVSGLTVSVADGSPVVSMTAPLRDRNGEVAGLVVGEIGLSGAELSDIVRPSAPGRTGYAQIVDSQGTVLASTSPDDALQVNPHVSLVAGLFESKQGSSGTCHSCHEAAGVTGDGEQQKEVMAFAPLEAAPWGVLIRQSESEALAPARRLEERAVWLGVPAFALALLFAWATVRSVVGPVKTLTAAAQKLASGDLSEPVPAMGADEIGRLAGAFETMRGRLKEAIETIQTWAGELEERVHERTRELEASRDHLRAVAEENATLYEEVKLKEAAHSELLKRVISAQEEERRRIARELHDETSQNLTVLVMGMETAALTPDDETARMRKKMGGLKDLAVKTLEGVHRLVYDLRPSVLDDLGLLAGLRWYAESRLKPMGVRVSLLVSGEERRLPAEVETALFRMGQEAISNVARHANAANVFLGVSFEDDRVTLEVEDDGEGFDVAADESKTGRHGWGLLGMRERATLFGGNVEIVSEPGSGTRVEVSIPLPGESDDNGRENPGTHSG